MILLVGFPERAFAKPVLRHMTFMTKRDGKPIIRLLTHAGLRSDSHMGDRDASQASAVAASMISHKVTVRP